MPEVLDKKVVEWRAAEACARAAEQALNKLLFDEGGQQPVQADLAQEAKRLRQVADEKLKAAIAAMGPRP